MTHQSLFFGLEDALAEARPEPGEVVNCILQHLREAPVSESARIGERLLVFGEPAGEEGRAGRTFIVVGAESGEHHIRLTLSWEVHDEEEAEEAERAFDSICLALKLALHGGRGSITEAEALAELTGQPTIPCDHCREPFHTASAYQDHMRVCPQRPRSLLWRSAARLAALIQGRPTR